MKTLSFSGSQGVGKTQTIIAVAKQLGIDYVPSCSSLAWKEYYQATSISQTCSWWNLPSEDQNLFQLYVAALSITNLARGGLQDRSIFDVMVYTEDKFTDRKVTHATLALINKLFQKSINQIDAFICFEADEAYKIEESDLRQIESQVFVNKLFQKKFSELPEDKRFMVPKGTISEKRDAILNYIRGRNF